LGLVKVLLCLGTLHLLLDNPMSKLGSKPVRVRWGKVLLQKPHVVTRLKRHLCELIYL
jgi:hypothetical protein